MMVDHHSILVIGNGGREHALCWKLAQSEMVENIYVAPGNIGIAKEKKVTLVKLNIKKNKKVADWCKEKNISLVVVGPEKYLVRGIADELRNRNISCFGPNKSAARIEANKAWSKAFMDRHSISTARWNSFTDNEEAKKFVKEAPFKALVIKAAGLAARKNVVVAKNKKEACEAIDDMLVNKKFGSAGSTVVVEELLEGEEVSVLAFTDGKTVVSMAPAQDHKRIFDNDEGLNTGGMGAYCPCFLLNEDERVVVQKEVLQKAVDGMRSENAPFVGVLFAGLMITADGPKVLEFNCRFGDPETQVILPLLRSDLFSIMKSCCEGNLECNEISWRENIFATGVILASRGYPESSSKGQVIEGIEEVASRDNHIIFHSGTAEIQPGVLATNGGRVLMVVALDSSLTVAASNATIAARDIEFDGKHYRTDIAHKGILRLSKLMKNINCSDQEALYFHSSKK